MAIFCSVYYCSYNIGILSTCSFLKRFKTTAEGETNLNRRCCCVFLKKIQCLSFSWKKWLLRQDLMNGSARWSGGAFQCNITSLSKDSWSRARLPRMCCFRIEAALSQTASLLILTTIREYKCRNCSILFARSLFVKKVFISFVVEILSSFV